MLLQEQKNEFVMNRFVVKLFIIIFHFVGIAEEEDVTQHPALGNGALALELAEEEHRVPKSHDKKVLAVAVTFLQLVVATLIAAQSIAHGAGTTGVLARLLVEGDARYAHGTT